ncbi:hypothetical protein HDV04_005321 [Boothiomyces sp. JEL0838]|nr:hypothetical protein HDV04_005321 [Boothiomyces sp. JEL0838]
MTVVPPVAKKVPYSHVYHGQEYPDEYHWLKDQNPKEKKPEVMEYIQAENEYTKQYKQKYGALSETIYNEIITRIKEDDAEVPIFKAPYYYYSRTEKGKNYPIRCRKKDSMEGAEEILLDLNERTEEFISLGAYVTSPNHKLLAYALDFDGSEYYTIYFKNLETGKVLEEHIEKTGGELAWFEDNKSIAYNLTDKTHRSYQVYTYTLGSPDHNKIYEEPDAIYAVMLSKSASKKYIFIESVGSEESETYYIDTSSPSNELKLFKARELRHLYEVTHQGNNFIVVSNGGGKYLNRRVCYTSTENTLVENWKEIVSYDPLVNIEYSMAFKNYLVVNERANAQCRFRVFDVIPEAPFYKHSHYIEAKDALYTTYPRHSFYEENILRYIYMTPLTSPATIDYDFKSKLATLRKQNEIPVDASKYTMKMVYAKIPKEHVSVAPFNTPVPDAIPISVIYKTDTFKGDGTNPALCYAYGSYGMPMDPYFSPLTCSYLDRGFVYAIAHIRGGGDCGKAWYETGKFKTKINTFRDFITSCKYLVDNNYTSSDRLAIQGGSAGGLLMGAVLNMEPSLYAVAVAQVPFVDVINTMMDDSIPLTTMEYKEWGNPNEKDYFDYMRSYSPYDNIPVGKKFPHLLIESGLFDPRVAYWEPAKWCAKLRAVGADGGESDSQRSTILMDCKISGHGGASGRYGRYKESAETAAFVVHHIEASVKGATAKAVEIAKKELPIDIANFDFSVSPSQSFYRYVNGGWLIKNKIPAEYSTWNTFRILDEVSKENLRVIFDDLLKLEPGTSLLAEFYASAMDEDAVEKAGLSPISGDLKAIDGIESPEQYYELTAKFAAENLGKSFWYYYVGADDRNSSMNTLMIGQSGLGLPNRDYYLDESKADKVVKYKEFLNKILKVAGQSADEAAKNTDAIYAFEKKVAEFSLPNDQLRDPVKTYNKRSLSELKSIAPAINWDVYFNNIGIQNATDIVLHNIEYFEKLSATLAETPLSTLKNYLKAHFISSAAPLLNKELVDIEFEFHSKALQGVKENKPRWKRATEWSNMLQDLLSEIYVAKHFSKKSKAAAADMVDYIIKAFAKRIEEIDWMAPATKEKARLKLSTFRVKIGYPDKWRDYSPLKGKIVRSNSVLKNFREVAKFNNQYENSYYNKPVDREKWFMPPYMVNAYYNPPGNEIVFPAAILQPPFFYAPTEKYPLGQPALNFGSIGGIISHEISHGYDDQGAKYDHEGNLVNWWTPEDSANFEARTKLIIEQFDEYTFFGEKLNGKLTAGENIADLGGISVSYKAFQEYIAVHGDKVKPFTSKFTREQEFFISWAQGWRNLITKDAAVMRIVNDPHAPGEHRTDGPLSNFSEFHKAFGVKQGDRMFREHSKQVSIWRRDKFGGCRGKNLKFQIYSSPVMKFGIITLLFTVIAAVPNHQSHYQYAEELQYDDDQYYDNYQENYYNKQPSNKATYQPEFSYQQGYEGSEKYGKAAYSNDQYSQYDDSDEYEQSSLGFEKLASDQTFPILARPSFLNQ